MARFHLKRLIVTIPLLGLLAGCFPSAQPLGMEYSLWGSIEKEPGYRAQATFLEVATAATVSLIDTTTNQTIATTVTNADGTFRMSFGSAFRAQSYPYILEAVKGLSNNAATFDGVRLRTIIQWQNGGWTSITSGIPGAGISIGRATTALAVIDNLRADVTADSLIGTVTMGLPEATPFPATDDSFATGATGITQQEYHNVYSAVQRAVFADTDPIYGISRVSGDDYRLITVRDPSIATVRPTSAGVGTQVTIEGYQFDGSGNAVVFGTATASILSETSTRIVALVPTDAGSDSVATNVTLYVQNQYGPSNGIAFQVLPPIGGSYTAAN